MDELKSCPFCGGTGCIIKSKFIGYNEEFFHAVCLDCSMEMRQYLCRTENEEIEAWNRRVQND